MSAREQRQAASAEGLSKQRVVLEAVRLADREGVHGLSMRRLADALGAGAMSLYHYVASKDELLDAMIDVVFEEIRLPPVEVDWQSAMRREAISPRGTRAPPVGDQPDGVEDDTGARELRHREAVTACLRRAGFTVVMATHANWLLSSHVTVTPCRKPACRSTLLQARRHDRDVYLPQLPLRSSRTSTSPPRRSSRPAMTRRRSSCSGSTSSSPLSNR